MNINEEAADLFKNLTRDCIYFKGEMPCLPHKKEKVRCKCQYYKKTGKKILIIKLGAVGDVIRTTPLITKLLKVYPDCEITWVTDTPEVLPEGIITILKTDINGITQLLADKFDILYNLDKAKTACALAKLIEAKQKIGYTIEDGKPIPINTEAITKYITGLDDPLMLANKKSYVEEIFDIVSLPFEKEKYLMKKPASFEKPLPLLKKPVIGLNTGCGARWTTRLWSTENWITLSKMLIKEGYSVVLLGGPQEDKRNLLIQKESNALYPGYFSFEEFISLTDLCDLIVTGVTMALHIAIGLEKKIVLLNNIFNRYEFELYGLGKIIEPSIPCLGCFLSECEKRFDGISCMNLVKPDEVFDAIMSIEG